MMRDILLEFYKLRRKRIGLMVFLLVGVEIGWAFMAVGKSFASNPELASWEPIISIVASLNGLFAPILAAICVTRICDMEHKGNTWKLLLSISVKRSRLYAAKYSCALFIMIGTSFIQVIAIAGFGLGHQLTESVPVVLLGRLFVGTVAAHMVVVALQQWVSMAAHNQAFALCLGMVGGFIGITADLFPSSIRQLFVWSYYSGLSPVQQSYTNNELQFIVRETEAGMLKLGLLLACGIVIYTIGCLNVSKKEV